MSLLDVGTEPPPFTLADQAGTRHALRDLRGRSVVVYFYPKDDTPGCTKEACAFRDLSKEFESRGATVFGISPDDTESHARFASKFSLPFTLLADPPGADGTPPVCSAWGVWQEKTMYGRTSLGVVRTTYLIGADGRIAKRWDRVSVDGHAEAVLAALDAVA